MLKKISLTAPEKTVCDTLITATGNYRLGNKAVFGSSIGSRLTNPGSIVE